MKRITSFLLCLSLLFSFMLSGCGENKESNDSSSKTNSASSESGSSSQISSQKSTDDVAWASVKVAIILPGSANDGSFNSFGYEGYTRLKELGCDASFSENVAFDKQLEAIRDYAELDYDIIIGWGAQYDDDLKVVAEEYPEIQFCVVSGTAANDTNMACLYVSCAHMGMAYGYMSAQVSKTNKVAFIAANQGNQAYTEEVCGFIEGVKLYNPDCEAHIFYVNDYSDISEAQQVSKPCVENSCDVMFADISEGYYGMLDVASQNGIKTFGRNSDNIQSYPDGVITYMENNWGPKMEDFVRSYLTDGMMNGIVEIGFGTVVRGWDYVYDETHEFNPTLMSDEMVADFKKNVIERISEERWDYSFTAEDANPGIY